MSGGQERLSGSWRGPGEEEVRHQDRSRSLVSTRDDTPVRWNFIIIVIESRTRRFISRLGGDALGDCGTGDQSPCRCVEKRLRLSTASSCTGPSHGIGLAGPQSPDFDKNRFAGIQQQILDLSQILSEAESIPSLSHVAIFALSP